MIKRITQVILLMLIIIQLIAIYDIGYILAFNEPRKFARPVPIQKTQTISIQSPTRLLVPSLNIDLTVEPSQVRDNSWMLNENTVSFGKGSSYLDEDGSTVLFGHAREEVLRNLYNVQVGQYIYVLSTSAWQRYQVVDIKQVEPHQVDKIFTEGDKSLNIFTCIGENDEYRLVVYTQRR